MYLFRLSRYLSFCRYSSEEKIPGCHSSSKTKWRMSFENCSMAATRRIQLTCPKQLAPVYPIVLWHDHEGMDRWSQKFNLQKIVTLSAIPSRVGHPSCSRPFQCHWIAPFALSDWWKNTDNCNVCNELKRSHHSRYAQCASGRAPFHRI